MTGHDPSTDRPSPTPDHEGLLRHLRDALDEGRADPSVDPPPHLLAAARAAFTWRRVDAELAELTDSAPLVGLRGNDGACTFTGRDGRRVDIELTRVGPRGVATGQLSPAARGVVRWESRHDGLGPPADVGDEGFFELDDVPTGPVRLLVTPDDGPPLQTDWIVA